MPNKAQPPKRQSKQSQEIKENAPENATEENTGTILVISIFGVLVFFAAVFYFSA